ncbi:enhancer of mRNA decapping [Rhizophlyctis rosea]|nr:enhancer of mRNA decapping [Rhizophlyctis rosea]
MSAKNFIGLDVRVYLSNAVLDGRVLNIDSVTQLLTLTEVTANINGVRHVYPSYQVPGTEIKDLQILPTAPPRPQPATPSTPTVNTINPSFSLPIPPAQPAYPPAAPGNVYSPAHVPLHQQSLPQQQVFPPQQRPIVAPRAAQLPFPEPLLHGGPHPGPGPVPQTLQTAPAGPQSPSPFVDPAIISFAQPIPIAKTPSSSSVLSRSQLPEPPQHTPTPKAHSHLLAQPFPKLIVTSQSEQEEEEIDYSDFGGKNHGSGSRNAQPARPNGDRRAKGRLGRQSGGEISSGGSQSPKTRGNGSPKNVPQSAVKHRRGRRDFEAFGGVDVGAISDDFDFQAGLAQFDKRQIFSEIREADQTDPDTLLVTLNKRRPHLHPLEKLGVHENVLDRSPSGDETGNDAEAESDLESDGFGIHGMNGDGVPRDGKRMMFRTITGVPVPTVTPAEMLEIERMSATETGPSEEQMLENGGRGAAMLVLQALGGGRRIKPGNHNEGPLVVVLAGNNQTGAYGLCAARHLANHECNVIVCVVGGEAELVNTLAYQQKIYLPTGGKLSKGIVDLPQSSQPVDLVIDALLGSNQTILDLSEADRNLRDQWNNRTPRFTFTSHKRQVDTGPRFTENWALPGARDEWGAVSG